MTLDQLTYHPRKKNLNVILSSVSRSSKLTFIRRSPHHSSVHNPLLPYYSSMPRNTLMSVDFTLTKVLGALHK